jgi:hypothetical protein
MQQEQDIEMQIWEYLDKQCTEEESSRIAMLISNDAAWKAKYQEILAFNSSLQDNLELEHPSMRFSQNIMDAIGKEQIAPSVKGYLNKWVIRGIAAFFIIVIGVMLTDILLSAEWGKSTTSILSGINIKKIKAPDLSNSTFIYGFACLNVLAGLLLLDNILRRKRHSTNDSN